MESFVATKLHEFEQGKISRRRLIEMLTLAATTVHAADAQTAAPAGVKVALVNHVSYTCPNFRQAGDWYSKVFNLDQVGLKDNEVTLPFGKKGEQPYNVTAKDVPLTFLLCRTRDLNAPPANGAAPRPKSTALIGHIGYTVADFERNRVRDQLKAMGVANVRDGGLYSLHMTDPFGYDVQISGLANNALTDG
jgi:catechol 2,3-dioxygenase-like lactoylglutathione lyase family enzyme